jgi:hypothetical protein
VDVEKAEELAEARLQEFSYSDANMGTKAYAALLSVARGGLYGHAAMLLMGEGALADIVLLTPRSAYDKAKDRQEGAARLWIRPAQAGVGGLWVSPAGRIGPPLRFCGTYWAEPLVRTSCLDASREVSRCLGHTAALRRV